MHTSLTEEELTEALGILDIPLKRMRLEQAETLEKGLIVVEELLRIEKGQRPPAMGDA